jgi:hypothetical protein
MGHIIVVNLMIKVLGESDETRGRPHLSQTSVQFDIKAKTGRSVINEIH